MTATERRFETSFKEVDRDEPGLVMEDDGTVWLVAPDGTRTELSAGGGSSAFENLAAPLALSDFIAVLDEFTQAYVPVGTLNDGDALLHAGVEVTEAFDDSGDVSFSVIATNVDPYTIGGVTFSGSAPQTVPNPTYGIGAYENPDNGPNDSSISGFVVAGAGPVTIYAYGSGFADDGATGALIVRGVIARAS